MKRFSDTARFSEPWYFSLPPEMKVAWEYLWAMCDNSGVWTPNFVLADMQIGKKVDWDKFTAALEGRIFKLENGKWFMPDFTKIQCGKLNPESRPHMAVIQLLRVHGLIDQDSFDIDYSRTIESVPRTIYSPKDKDKEEDKETDKTRARPKKDKATLEEVIAFCVENDLPESDGEACFHKWEGNGWTNGKAKIVCWKSTIRSWHTAGYLPSQKPGSITAKPVAKQKTRHDFIKAWETKHNHDYLNYPHDEHNKPIPAYILGEADYKAYLAEQNGQ